MATAIEERTSLMVPPFLPFEAEYHSASVKKFAEVIVFVHHFGGNARSLMRHVHFVNDLGFDAVTFDLLFCQFDINKPLPITAGLKIGARFVWTEQIEAILNAVPGKKIVYSFSMPSNSALGAIAHRRAEDLSAWVCDGGPFIQLPTCVWNLFRQQYRITSRTLRMAYTIPALLFYGVGFEGEVPQLLRALPKTFPILSIRGLSDPLVPPEAIDDLFQERKSLNLETISFAEGKHLDGLKNFADDYIAQVGRFLKSKARVAN